MKANLTLMSTTSVRVKHHPKLWHSVFSPVSHLEIGSLKLEVLGRDNLAAEEENISRGSE